MSAINPHIDDLLVKYLVGEADEAETREVLLWINQNHDNQKYFEHFKLIWDESRQLASKSDVDEDAAWLRLRSRISKPDEQQRQTATIKPMYTRKWLSIAAAMVLISIVGYIMFNNLNKVTMVNLQSNNQVLKNTLPDGSIITLNANSALTYPDKFKGDTRKVSLQGEAFFSVSPDKTKPFIITVNDVTVRVVGTSFNIKSRKGKTEVIVETGIVRVSRDNKSVELHKGEKTTAGTGAEDLAKLQNNAHFYSYYRTRVLVCNSTPLGELIPALNEIFGADIVIARPGLQNERLSTTFKDQSLDEILMVIGETFKLRVEHRGKQILLK